MKGITNASAERMEMLAGSLSTSANGTFLPRYKGYDYFDRVDVNVDATVYSKKFLEGTLEELTPAVMGNATYITATCFSGDHVLKKVVLNSHCTEIRSNAFYNAAVEEADLSAANLTKVHNYAFCNCKVKKPLKLGNVDTIGDYAFANLYDMPSISMGTVREMGPFCFQNACALVSQDIPESCETMKAQAFSVNNANASRANKDFHLVLKREYVVDETDTVVQKGTQMEDDLVKTRTSNSGVMVFVPLNSLRNYRTRQKFTNLLTVMGAWQNFNEGETLPSEWVYSVGESSATYRLTWYKEGTLLNEVTVADRSSRYYARVEVVSE